MIQTESRLNAKDNINSYTVKQLTQHTSGMQMST